MDRYFEDFVLRDRFRSQGVTLTESEIVRFALEYDPQPFHIDLEAAAKSPFGGLMRAARKRSRSAGACFCRKVSSRPAA